MRLATASLVLGLLLVTPQTQADDFGNPPTFSTLVYAVPSAPSIADDYLARARDLVLHAMGLLGVHYRYGGSSPETGFDCSGLVQYVYRKARGLALPRTTYDISRAGETVSKSELLPGDLVFFNTMRQPFSHVGIYLGDGRFIHAPSSGGRVEIVSMTNLYWRQRYNGARRIIM